MKVLVTGGTGFVGSHAVREILNTGHEVRMLARTPAKVPGVLTALGIAESDRPEVVAGDMTDPDTVEAALDGCDAVLHCAAEIGVAGGRGPSSTANIDGTRLIVDTAVKLGLDPIVYTSTITVHLPAADPIITHSTPLADPLSAYGAQKRLAEEYVQAAQAVGAPITTLVVGGVYGPHSPHLDGSHSALIAALRSGMYAPDGGLGVLDVRDLATLIARTLIPGQGPRRYFASGRYITWRHWAELLSRAAGRPVPYHVVPVDDMIQIGRELDAMRVQGRDVPPLSYEAAVIMSSGRPADDTATLTDLDLTYRPTIDTFRDTIAWLGAQGRLPRHASGEPIPEPR
ncbi:NAD-dependent epimerase/dehydratase family protein [Spirillospora sp. NPDC047418]